MQTQDDCLKTLIKFYFESTCPFWRSASKCSLFLLLHLDFIKWKKIMDVCCIVWEPSEIVWKVSKQCIWVCDFSEDNTNSFHLVVRFLDSKMLQTVDYIFIGLIFSSNQTIVTTDINHFILNFPEILWFLFFHFHWRLLSSKKTKKQNKTTRAQSFWKHFFWESFS